jgi:hypothetical protein
MLRLLRVPLIAALVALGAFAWETGNHLSESMAANDTTNETLAEVTGDEYASAASAPAAPIDSDRIAQDEREATQLGREHTETAQIPAEAEKHPERLAPSRVAVENEPLALLKPTLVTDPTLTLVQSPQPPRPFPLPSTTFDAHDEAPLTNVPPLPADTAFLETAADSKATPVEPSPAEEIAETTQPLPANPALPEDTDLVEPLVLTNAADSHTTIRFLVNGQLQSLEPGASYRHAANDAPRIQFHRGGKFGNADHTLSAGNYAFRVNGRGWTLAPVQDD